MPLKGARNEGAQLANSSPHGHAEPYLVKNNPSVARCCVPSGCEGDPIHMNDLSSTVKVICNNEHCNESRFMHKACFEQFEETVLNYLRSTGRARSWSEKQRLQNLWTKKGYDLAYKACGCKCQKGHLRKDLDWQPPVAGQIEEVSNKKKRNRKKRNNDKPILALSQKDVIAQNKANASGMAVVANVNANHTNGNVMSLSNLVRMRSLSMSSAGSGGSLDAESSSPPASIVGDSAVASMKKYFFNDNTRRERHISGSIFSRRQDYSSFNTLPRHKINSYHIKMEDDGNHGNDETRCFILSTLSANKMNRVSCVLCQGTMIIFDRYPLIDGTFFLSPRQHNKTAVPVHFESRVLHMNAVCMGCLEGWNISLHCKHCLIKWNGAHLILGSMYSYDIFAAVPCCVDRLRCNNCQHLVIPAERPLEFFSDYSHSLPCGHCGIVDHHFVKSLSQTYVTCDRE